MTHPVGYNPTGYTLVELLVVLALLGFLVGAGVAAFWVLFQSYWSDRMQDPLLAEKIGTLREMI